MISMKVLIVEDEYNLADVIKERLEKEKLTVDIVEDGEEGYYYASTNTYDLIILDVMLPNMSGFQILNKLRADNISSKIIMLTARSTIEDKLNGMGTTVTACLVTSQNIYVANVGDSCCMAIKNGELKKITKDHSLVQELLDSGTIGEFGAINHPKRNIITRALGTSMDVDVDVFKLKALEYDLFILCSDGLTNEVTKDEILRIISNENNYISIANDLVNLAKEKGGRDNITVLLFGGEM